MHKDRAVRVLSLHTCYGRYMRIGIIAGLESKTVEDELVPAARARGHVCEVIQFPLIDISQFNEEMVAQDLRLYDVLYYRTGLGPIGALFLRKYLAHHNLIAVNLGPDTHVSGEIKSFQVLRAARAGVRLARTIVNRTGTYKDVRALLGVPFVAKPDNGSQGKGVVLVDSEESFDALDTEVGEAERIYQEFIPHACDYRVHIVGGKAVAAYSRVSAPEEFRTNVSQGGAMCPIEETARAELYALAENINKVFGYDIAAIDFLVHKNTGELCFGEVNSNPGWEESDAEATGVDMTTLVLDYLESLGVRA